MLVIYFTADNVETIQVKFALKYKGDNSCPSNVFLSRVVSDILLYQLHLSHICFPPSHNAYPNRSGPQLNHFVVKIKMRLQRKCTLIFDLHYLMVEKIF